MVAVLPVAEDTVVATAGEALVVSCPRGWMYKKMKLCYGSLVPTAMSNKYNTLRAATTLESGREKLAARMVNQLYKFAAWKQAADDANTAVLFHESPHDIAAPHKVKVLRGYVASPPNGRSRGSIEVFVGPKRNSPIAYVLRQHKSDDTGYVDRVVMGVESGLSSRLFERGKALAKTSGVNLGNVVAKFTPSSAGAFNPADNIKSLSQKWKPPKMPAPSVKAPPGTPKLNVVGP